MLYSCGYTEIKEVGVGSKMRSKKILISILIFVALCTAIIIFVLPNSRATDSEHLETTIVSMDMFDGLLLYVPYGEVYRMNSHFNSDAEQRTLNYHYFRELLLQQHPYIDIAMFDSYMNTYESILNQYINEVTRVVTVLDSSTDIICEWFNLWDRRPHMLTPSMYFELEELRAQTKKNLYNLTATLINENIELFRITHYDPTYGNWYEFNWNFRFLEGLLNRDIEWISIDVRWPCRTICYFESSRNKFGDLYDEIDRQLSYLISDVEERENMITRIFNDANIDLFHRRKRNYINKYIDKKQRKLIMYQNNGVSLRLYNVIDSSSRMRWLDDDDEFLTIEEIANILLYENFGAIFGVCNEEGCSLPALTTTSIRCILPCE